jgi:hypothetical protein
MGRFVSFLKWAVASKFRTTKPRISTRGQAGLRRRLFFEDLEPKAMLSASLPIPADAQGGALTSLLRLSPSNAAISLGSATPAGLTPNQIRGAYGLGSYTSGVLSQGISFDGVQGDGRGQTIAIVDAYDDPTALSDLNAFSTYYGLPTFNGTGGPTFQKLNQNGGTTLPGTDPTGPSNNDWEGEEALDIEWAHVIAPMANIILFEATNDSRNGSNLFVAAKTAANTSGVVAVSMSWTYDESGFTASQLANYDTTVFATPQGHIGGSATLGGTGLPGGVTFLAAAGDAGPYEGNNTTTISPQYPATSPNVVAVGGTTLTVNGSNPNYTYGGETAWGNGVRTAKNGGGGGGISAAEGQPSYQNGVVNAFSTTQRTYPDVSADANPNSGVPIYDVYDDGASTPWSNYNGGTSLACPIWAGVIAVADEGRAVVGLGSLDGRSQTLPDLYKLPGADFNDILSGSTGPSPLYAAGPGYDLATGIGSPISNLLIPGLVGNTPAITGITPDVGRLAGGTTVTITGTNLGGVTAVNFGGIPATSFTINSPTQVSATSPAVTTATTVDITVTGPGGTSATSTADQFSYTVVAPSSIVGMATDGSWWIANSTGTSFVNQYWGSWNTATGWKYVQSGDFLGNGKTDIVGMAPDGTWWVAVSTASGFVNQNWGSWNGALAWKFVHVADINGDGKADIVGMAPDGSWWVATSTGMSFVSQYWGSWNANVAWQDVQTADLTGNGKADIVGMAPDGSWWVALSTGTTFTSQYWGSWNPTAGWQDVQVGDFTGNGMDDIAGMTSSGAWWIAVSNGTTFTNQYWGSWNASAGWQDVQIADFNGDGKADIVGMTSSGAWWVAISTGSNLSNQYWGNWNPNAGWQNVQIGDFNGDGKLDIVGRTSTGDWWVGLSNSTSTGFVNQYWGNWNSSVNWQYVQAGLFD